jgi:hypothetical protein
MKQLPPGIEDAAIHESALDRAGIRRLFVTNLNQDNNRFALLGISSRTSSRAVGHKAGPTTIRDQAVRKTPNYEAIDSEYRRYSNT